MNAASRALALALSVAPVLGACEEPEPANDDDATTPRVTDPVAVIGGADVLVRVGETLSLDGSGSEDTVSFRWDFGDGVTSEVSEDPSATHAYSEPGHYLVALEVFAEDGRPDVATARVSVAWPRSNQRVTRANVLDLDWDEDSVLVAATDFDAVAIYRPAQGAVSGWYDTCSRPATVSHSRSLGNPNALFVACPEADEVQVWDTANQTLQGSVSLPPGSHPYSVVAPTVGTSGWVALQATGQVVEIVAPLNGSPTLGRTLDVLPDPRGLTLVGEALLVSQHRSPDDAGRWARVDLDTDEVTIFDLALSLGPDSDTTSRGVPSYLQQIGVSPDGRSAWFPSLQANVQRGLWREGQALTHETTVRAVASSVALTDDEAAFGGLQGVGSERERAVLDDRGLAASVAFSPDGDWTYVGFLGNESVTVLDSYTRQASGATSGLTGGAEGLLTSPDGLTLFVASRVGRALWEISLDTPLPDVTRTVSLVQPGDADPLPDAVRRGRLIFQRSADPRMTQDGYISCAVCHLDGTHDGRTWDFTDRGEGLRNTISLRGRAGAHGPLHWSGNFDEVQDFENDVRGPQAGAGFLSDSDWLSTSDTLGPSKEGLSEDLDALAAYVESLDSFLASPWRDTSGDLSVDAQAGAALFVDPAVGCADCHPAPLYTDSQWLAPGQPLLYDVGTLTEASGGRLGGELLGIDTPSLLGVHASAPYLHDGSAASLREVLVDRNPGDAHGATSHLTEAELQQLERFLLELH